MDWKAELLRFGLHAGIAAAAIWIAMGPCNRRLGRIVERIGAARRGRVIAAAVVLTVVLRVALLPVVRPAYATDVEEYCEKAAAIAVDGHPRAQETRADGTHFYRTLGWSLPLAGWYRVTGMPETAEGRLRAAQTLGILVAGAVAALLVLLGDAVRDPVAGRVAAFGYALYLPAATFSLIPYTETWAALLVVAAAWLFARADNPSFLRVVISSAAFGLLSGLLLITRTEFAWIPLLAAVFLVRELRLAAVFPLMVGAVCLLLPLAANHRMRDGYPGNLRTSVQSGLILYYGNNATEVTGQGNATKAVQAEVAALYAEDPTGATARDAALAWMSDHPIAAAANAPKKFHHLWFAAPQGFTWQLEGADGGARRWLLHAAWVQSLALFLLALAAIVRRAGVPSFWTAAFALHALTWCVLAPSARNRYPLEPLLLVAAAMWVAPRLWGGDGSGETEPGDAQE